MQLPRLDIAIFHSSFESRGGAEALLADFARALMDRGHHVRVLTFGFDAERWNEAFLGAEVVKLDSRGTWEKFRPWSREAWYRRSAGAVEKACEGCDVVMAVNHPAAAVLALSGTSAFKLWYCLEPPRSLHVAGANPRTSEALRTGRLAPHSLMGSRIRKALNKHRWKQIVSPHHRDRAQLDLKGVRAMDGIWALGLFSAENVQHIYGREASVFSPAVPFPDQAPDFRPLDRHCLRILSLSRLESFKGFETLLKGLATFLKSNPGRAVLDIVGQGQDRSELESMASKLDLGEAVRFFGYLPSAELEATWSLADVFALLPVDEPFGMVFVEAAARGVLAVGSNHGGPAEILGEGQGGILVDPFQADAFASALEKILALTDDAALRLREHAYHHAAAHYAAQDLGERLETALRDLLQGKA